MTVNDMMAAYRDAVDLEIRAATTKRSAELDFQNATLTLADAKENLLRAVRGDRYFANGTWWKKGEEWKP